MVAEERFRIGKAGSVSGGTTSTSCLTAALPPDAPNLVDDEWSKMKAYPALIGTPGIKKMEELPGYVAELHARDIPRAERIRARCDEVVNDQGHGSEAQVLVSELV